MPEVRATDPAGMIAQLEALLSVEELAERIALMNAEIERLQAAPESRIATRSTAAGLARRLAHLGQQRRAAGNILAAHGRALELLDQERPRTRR